VIPERLNPRRCSAHGISALILLGVDIRRIFVHAHGRNACHIQAGDSSLAATTATACPIVTGARAAYQEQYHQEKTF
jgi:hypothetical protein